MILITSYLTNGFFNNGLSSDGFFNNGLGSDMTTDWGFGLPTCEGDTVYGVIKDPGSTMKPGGGGGTNAG